MTVKDGSISRFADSKSKAMSKLNETLRSKTSKQKTTSLEESLESGQKIHLSPLKGKKKKKKSKRVKIVDDSLESGDELD